MRLHAGGVSANRAQPVASRRRISRQTGQHDVQAGVCIGRSAWPVLPGCGVMCVLESPGTYHRPAGYRGYAAGPH